MILAIGLGLLGLFALRRAHRRCHGYHHHGHGHGYGHGWRGPWAPPWHEHGPKSWLLHRALVRLDATPAQERAIVAEVDRLTERAGAARVGLRDVRGDLAAAIRGDAVDDAALGAALGRLDTASTDLRRAAIDALRAIHAVLDDKQRAKLAEMIDHSGSWWRGGPYR